MTNTEKKCACERCANPGCQCTGKASKTEGGCCCGGGDGYASRGASRQ